MENLQKKLTKFPYLLLLSVIGRSPVPLSSYEIKKALQESSYTYKRIMELTGIPEEPFDDILSNTKYRRKNRKMYESLQKAYKARLKKAARGPRFLNIHVGKRKKYDRRRWRYSLNFRGLLLYLDGESKARRRDRRRVHHVLSNPLIIEQAPFLAHWHEFESAGFDVIGTLLQIGSEFENLLDYDADYLLLRASERYFIAFSNFFDRYRSAGSFHIYAQKVSRETDARILQYRLQMLREQKVSLEKEIATVDRWIDAYAAEAR